MDRQIDSLSGHTIVCGYGRVGCTDRAVARRLGTARSSSSTAIQPIVARAAEDGWLAVTGDSTEDETLHLAGNRAGEHPDRVAWATTPAAISTVLSARVLNPEMRIVARANAASSEAKLQRAGCDRVVNPLHQGAQRMAAFAEQPAVADFLDVVVHDGSLEYRLEEIVVPPGSLARGHDARRGPPPGPDRRAGAGAAPARRHASCPTRRSEAGIDAGPDADRHRDRRPARGPGRPSVGRCRRAVDAAST